MKDEKVLVLGAGSMGRVIAEDLACEFSVTVADVNEKVLAEISIGPIIKTQLLDMTDHAALCALAQKYDIVCGAMPGNIAFRVLEALAKIGVKVVDISFFEENPVLLNQEAIKNGGLFIVHDGVDPGDTNMLVGREVRRGAVYSVKICAAGLPKERMLPWQYLAPFAPITYIHEGTREVLCKENGCIIKKPALSETHKITIPNVGEVEAFLTNNLGTLPYTMPTILNMKPYTCRYGGHRQLFSDLISAGFLSDKPLDTPTPLLQRKDMTRMLLAEWKKRNLPSESGNVSFLGRYVELEKALEDSEFFTNDSLSTSTSPCIPLEMSLPLLSNAWKLTEDDDEFTFVHIEIEKKEGDKDKGRHTTYDLYVERDWNSGLSSMAQATAFKATADVRWILRTRPKLQGVCPIELLAMDDSYFEFNLKDMHEHGLSFKRNGIVLY